VRDANRTKTHVHTQNSDETQASAARANTRAFARELPAACARDAQAPSSAPRTQLLIFSARQPGHAMLRDREA
jgi:hypothetical protein